MNFAYNSPATSGIETIHIRTTIEKKNRISN